MNPSPAPSPSGGKSSDVESPRKETGNLQSRDFPSGDEEDRKGGNAGPEEKRHPDGAAPRESASLSEKEKHEAADWSKRTPAGTPEKPGTGNPTTYK